jgi:hypothetical protein
MYLVTAQHRKPGHVKADSHITCRAHAVSLPCLAAKGLECRGHAMLCQCRSSQGHGTARPSRDGLWAICPPSASFGHQAEFHEDFIRSIAILLTMIHTYYCKEW